MRLASMMTPWICRYASQQDVDVNIFQGDDPDALKNIPLGNFRIEGLTATPDPNEVLCRMNLDLDGILKVTAIEKRSGKSKHITIHNALQPKSDVEIAAARTRLQDLYASRIDDDAMDFDALGDLSPSEREPGEGHMVTTADDDAAEQVAVDPPESEPVTMDRERAQTIQEARALITRSRQALGEIHDDDKEEMRTLHEEIEEAIREQNTESLSLAIERLKELLFFIEGQ